MEKYDDYLSFNLPEGYYAIQETNDEGALVYSIKSGKSVDDEGKDTYKNIALVQTADFGSSPFVEKWSDSGFSLNGALDTYITVITKEMNVLVFTLNVCTAIMWVRKDDHVYVITSNHVTKAGSDETPNEWVGFLNDILNAIVIDGTTGEFDNLTAEKMFSEKIDLDEEEAKNSDIPVAKPLKGQHTHLDHLNKTKESMSIFNGLLGVNQTGTEYSFVSIAEMADEDSSELSSIYNAINEADSCRFDLVDTAHDMAELFRMDVEFFDAGHDREQEILNGLIQRASVYNTFRSFAWTLQAFCEKEGHQPVDLDINTIQGLADFIDKEKKGLNYVADSYSPAICSGDDLHNYFIPDAVSDDLKKRLLKIVNKNTDDDQVAVCDVRSLDSLRKELDYMYPAIKAIYDELAETRDNEEPLVDGVADILYAWCSIAYAARQPFFTEDGPMNCWWEHPDLQEDWETKWRIDQLEDNIKRGKEWVKRYSKDLSNSTAVTFKDKKFVFAGVDSCDEWLDILQRLTELGGVERSAVSGKTDYLVWEPTRAGDTKVKHALEQRIKGKDVKIVLFEDFLKAIKMKAKTPEEELAELKAEKEKKPAEKKIKEVKRTIIEKTEETESFTYSEGLQAKGSDYVFDIPDGFVIKTGAEGRDFVAYIPNDENPDSYEESRFVIYAGQKQESELFTQLRTVAEFSSIVRGIANAAGAAFADSKVITYERTDLPGAIIYAFDPGCLHVNAYMGIGDHLQSMRLLINGVNRKNKSAYETVSKELFDHMSTSTPAQLLQSLDSEVFINMSLSDKNVLDWTNCVEEYVNHLAIARNIWQNGLVTLFKEKQSKGDANIQQLKKDVKDMLKHISGYAETELKKADLIYTLKRAEYPKDRNLDKLKEAVESLAQFATQTVELNGQQITVESEYAKTVESRFGESATDAIEQVMKNIDVTSNKTAVDALNKAKGDYEQARKAVEEKARKENERKQDEAIRTLKYYISHFTDNWNSELEYSNYEILNQKDKPITRSNDSRIKKMIANSEAVIQKYADKLQEIMDKLNEIGEQKRADKVPDPEIVEIADLIIDCYEKLHMKAEVEIYGEPDVFKSTIDKKYSLMSSKWKRIRKAQPSIRAGEIQEELEDLQRELREAKKTLASAKRKCTMLRPAVTSLEETYEKKRKLSETANQELESRRPQYETELLEVTGNIEDAQEKRNKLNARIETLNKDTSEIKRDYSGRIQEITKEKYAEEAVLKELVNKRIPLINIEKQARNRVSGAVLFKKKKQDEADAAAKKLNDANLIIDEKTSAINILSQKIDSLKTEMEQKLDALNGEIKSAEKERNDVMQHLAELEGKADSLKNALGQYEDAAEFAADEMLEAKVAFNNKRKELEKLEQELAYDQKDVDKLLRKIEKTENEIKELKSSASNPAETVAKSRSGKATKKTET